MAERTGRRVTICFKVAIHWWPICTYPHSEPCVEPLEVPQPEDQQEQGLLGQQQRQGGREHDPEDALAVVAVDEAAGEGGGAVLTGQPEEEHAQLARKKCEFVCTGVVIICPNAVQMVRKCC